MACDGFGNVLIGYSAGFHSGNVSIGNSTPWPRPNFQQDATPAAWHCAYCDRENHGVRLTCAGCQAGRPREAEDAGLEIRVFGSDSVVLHEVRERWEEQYRGPQPRPAILPIDGGARQVNRLVLQKLKSLVGIR